MHFTGSGLDRALCSVAEAPHLYSPTVHTPDVFEGKGSHICAPLHSDVGYLLDPRPTALNLVHFHGCGGPNRGQVETLVKAVFQLFCDKNGVHFWLLIPNLMIFRVIGLWVGGGVSGHAGKLVSSTCIVPRKIT